MDGALIAAALPYYLEQQHRGVMIPCPYIKKKSSGLVETGIVYFVGPDVASRAVYHGKNGSIAMYFAIHGSHHLVTKSPINEADLTWGHVVRSGFSRLPYIPMVPAAVPGSLPDDISRA